QGVALDAGIHDQQVLVEHGGRAGPPPARAFADQDMPELLAVEIETEDPRLAEEDIEFLAVGDRRAGGVTMVGAFAGVAVFGKGRFEYLRPDGLAVAAIQTQEMPAEFLLLARRFRVHAVAGIAGDVDALAEDHRAGGAGAGQLHFPGDVVLRRPPDRQPSLVAGPLSGRPTELAPVRAHGRPGRRQQEQHAGGSAAASHEQSPLERARAIELMAYCRQSPGNASPGAQAVPGPRAPRATRGLRYASDTGTFRRS